MKGSEAVMSAVKQTRAHPSVDGYVELIEAFLAERVSAPQFEARYLALFKSDRSSWPEPIYEILNELFLDVDAFCADPAIRLPDELDEPALRSRASGTLAALAGVAATASTRTIA